MKLPEDPIWPELDTFSHSEMANVLYEYTPEPSTADREKAMTVLYHAARYASWYANPSEIKIRCWAEMFPEPQLTPALLEWAVHEHFKTCFDGRMVAGDVRHLAINLITGR